MGEILHKILQDDTEYILKNLIKSCNNNKTILIFKDIAYGLQSCLYLVNNTVKKS